MYLNKRFLSQNASVFEPIQLGVDDLESDRKLMTGFRLKTRFCALSLIIISPVHKNALSTESQCSAYEVGQ